MKNETRDVEQNIQSTDPEEVKVEGDLDDPVVKKIAKIVSDMTIGEKLEMMKDFHVFHVDSVKGEIQPHVIGGPYLKVKEEGATRIHGPEDVEVRTVYTLPEIAQKYGIGWDSLQRYIKQGHLKVLQIGHDTVALQTALDEFLNSK